MPDVFDSGEDGIVKKNEKNSKKVLTEKANAYIIVNVAGEQHQRRQRMWEFSSAGRASALQAECRRFDPVNAHHAKKWCRNGGTTFLHDGILWLFKI